MKKSFYQLSISIILIGTLFIAGRYLRSNRQPDPGPETETIHTLTPEPPEVDTPVPTSTPILPPGQSSLTGDLYYFNGDWENAIRSYEETLASAQTTEEGSGALLGRGKI